jgi:queuine tRNA-ribosyltransferase
MVFDECTPYPSAAEETARSMELSLRWAERSKAAFKSSPGHALFGIVQGGVYPGLRLQSAATLASAGFDGYAVGGLAVGEGQELMFRILDKTALPADKPRYLMGAGRPADILGAVRRGIDMFDCVLPTRSGRTAQAFTRDGMLNLRNARHADDAAPLDRGCSCSACRGFTRAYLHHLIKAEEILGVMLLTQHNLTFYQDFMRALRDGIEAGVLDKKLAEFPIAAAEAEVS